MNKFISNNANSNTVVLQCGCIAHCSSIEFSKFANNIHINILHNIRKRRDQNRLNKLMDNFMLSIEELERLLVSLNVLYEQTDGKDIVFFDSNETFILALDTFYIKPNKHSNADCYSFIFYNNMKDYLKGKYSYDITITRKQLKQLISCLTVFIPEVTR